MSIGDKSVNQEPKLKLIFARLRDLFDDISEDILRLYIAINFGKEHIGELTDSDLDKILEWVDGLPDRN
jgi:hypothetical protein